MDLLTKLDSDDYINDLTKEMDKHLLPGWPDYLNTYLWKPFEKDGTAIRFPGATRGHVEFDDDLVITDIVLYDTASENCIACYKPSIHEAVKQFIGSKIVIQEEKIPSIEPDQLHKEGSNKQVDVVGHGTFHKARRAIAGLTSAISALSGGYESSEYTCCSMKSIGYFPRYERNVPQYMPKKAQGRNERCNCHSGLKYKNCCGK